MRWKLVLTAGLALAAAAALSIEFQLWNPRRAAVEAAYVAPDSRFVVIDGLRLHYKDTGRGPAVLLWHGNFGSLDFYDGWVAQLSDRYRLIRFDINGSGLSGPDEKVDFTIERNLRIARTLLDQLGVDRYFVVGTSSAAPMAYRDAAERPERVLGLMLANAGGLPRKPGGEINRPLPNPLLQWFRERYRPRSFWRDRGLQPPLQRLGGDTGDDRALLPDEQHARPQFRRRDRAPAIRHRRCARIPRARDRPDLRAVGGRQLPAVRPRPTATRPTSRPRPCASPRSTSSATCSPPTTRH